MTPRQFLQAYHEETRRPRRLRNRWVNIGQDEHAREIINRIIGLPMLAELSDGAYMLYDGGKYLMLIEDPNVAHGYFAIPRGMLQEQA